MINVFLDDIRHPDEQGWVHVTCVKSCIDIIKNNQISRLSLDYDLGDGGCGYDVLTWLEKQIFDDEINFIPCTICLHSANPPGRNQMISACEAIKKLIEEKNIDIDFDYYTRWIG